MEALWSYEADDGEEIDFPETAGPFCGCDVCIVREVLWAAWPIFEEHHTEAPLDTGAPLDLLPPAGPVPPAHPQGA